MQKQSKTFSYEVRRSDRKKTVLIRVTSAGVVQVLAPRRLSSQAIGDIVQAKTRWIEGRLAEHRDSSQARADRGFADGDDLLYRGEAIRLAYDLRAKDARLWRDRLKFDRARKTLRIRMPEALPAEERLALARERAEAWLRAEAERIFIERVAFYAPLLSVEPGRITVKRLRSKWGSCSSLGNLNFNFRLVQAPPAALDYVTVHELCHLKHADHSPRFWALVERIYPDYKAQKRWLRAAARELLVD